MTDQRKVKPESRRVRWFSDGAASAVATKLDIQEHGVEAGPVVICDTNAEDEDKVVELIEQLRVAPDINNARILDPDQRVPEVVIPKALAEAAIAALSASRMSEDAK